MSRKTGQEAKVERLTWFAMCMIFILLSFDENISIPEYLIPFTVSAILLGSSLYQYTKNWQVSPINWLVAALLIAVGVYDIYFNLPIDLILVSLMSVVGIIIFGVITNES